MFLLDFGLGALIITIFLATMGLYRNQIDAYLGAKGNSLKKTVDAEYLYYHKIGVQVATIILDAGESL